MISATVADFEATIRRVTIKESHLFMSKMLDLCVNRGMYVAHFGSAMDNFAEAFQGLAEDCGSPRLAKLIKSLFTSSNLGALLDAPPKPSDASA